MNDVPRQYSAEEISALFSTLKPRDVEQFFGEYQSWFLQQQISQLQGMINALQQQLAQNATHLQELHPSAIALSTLAQLQAHGVNDIDLLDRLLERGEDWLDRTMQRLAYCEKAALISDNYTEWCEHALEGAYDWIDAVQEDPAPSQADEQSPPGEQITEAILLQKLMSDEADGQDKSEILQDTTLKRHAPTPADIPLVEASDGPSSSNGASEQIQPEQPEAPGEQEQAAGDVEETSPAAQSGEQPPAGEAEVVLAAKIAQAEVTTAAPPGLITASSPSGELPAEAQATSQAAPDQEHEQILQPTPRWRKQGFFQWLFSLLRP